MCLFLFQYNDLIKLVENFIDRDLPSLPPSYEAPLQEIKKTLSKYKLEFSTYSDIKLSNSLVWTMEGFVITYGAVLSQIMSSQVYNEKDMNFVLEWINNASSKNCVSACTFPPTATVF